MRVMGMQGLFAMMRRAAHGGMRKTAQTAGKIQAQAQRIQACMQAHVIVEYTMTECARCAAGSEETEKLLEEKEGAFL